MAEPGAGLPPAKDLIEAARKALADGTDVTELLDRWAPAIDELADIETFSAWLGVSRETIYRERSRVRADGSPGWPEKTDGQFGRSGAWRYRTVVVHRASMSGRGSAGRGRPRPRPAATD